MQFNLRTGEGYSSGGGKEGTEAAQFEVGEHEGRRISALIVLERTMTPEMSCDQMIDQDGEDNQSPKFDHYPF